MSTMDYAAPGGAPIPQNLLPGTAQQALQRNPMLPQHPVDVAMDSQYYAQEALLRQQVSQQYADLLTKLGYTDPTTGAFIPGSVSTQAAQQQADLQRSSDLAGEDVTNTAQQQGTLFSGRRGDLTARAQYPFQQQIAQLGVDVPLQLSDLYRQASGLTDQYLLQQNQLLADAAQRRAQAQAQEALANAMANYGKNQQPQATGGGEAPPEQQPGGEIDTSGLTQAIPPPTSGTGIGYYGSGAGGFTGSTTPPAVVKPATQAGSANSPYYYGGGGARPR